MRGITTRLRLFGVAAVAALLCTSLAPRAEAVSLATPAGSGIAKSVSGGALTDVRFGGGGGGHGGFGGHMGGGGHVGGFGAHVGGFAGHVSGFHGARIGGFHGAPMYRSHIGGYRYGAFRYGGYPYFHRHHFHRGFYYGGYYPYYYHHRCRIVWTYWGPRRVCHWPWHHWRHRHYWRHHHYW